MSKKNLAARALKIIYRYWSEHDHSYPTSNEIAIVLDITVNHWDRIRAGLVEGGYLERSSLWGISFTEQGLREVQSYDLLNTQLPLLADGNSSTQVFSSRQLSVNELAGQRQQNNIPPEEWSQVPLYGQVKAGSGARLDDLKVLPGDETIGIPHQFKDVKKIGVLEVLGESMVHENIYPGDFVIYERVDFMSLKENDLVIVYYLPEEYNRKMKNEIELAIQDHNTLGGPTLKYYFREKRGDGEAIYRLSWKTDAQDSEFKIYTRYIDPNQSSRVIAVYRPEKIWFINPSSQKTQ